jgi:tetratricopeptide (TPR) repeat protein
MARLYDFRSVQCQQAGDLDQAERAARDSLRYRGNFMDPWNSLGALADIRAGGAKNPAEKEKYFQLAGEYFQKAIELSPYSLTPRENQIQDMVKRGRFEEALDLQKELIERAPELPTSYSGLGLLYLRMGHPREALLPAQKVINLDPYFLPGYLVKGQALEALGKKKEALKTYEDAREMLKNIDRPDPSGQIEPRIQKLKSKK